MQMRERFERKLNELRDEILKMGSMVDEELKLALEAFGKLDTDLVRRVYEADKAVNAMRFAIEEDCFTLIATQQPAARDLRAIIAVMNIIVDLERMGDQAKGIAKVVPHILQPDQTQSSQIQRMGDIVGLMLRQSMTAYAHQNVDLAKLVTTQDNEVDKLYAQFFTQIMKQMAESESPDKVEAEYEILRVARELERYGDLATNVAERVIYIVTGNLHETNADPDDVLEHYLGR